MAVTIDHVSGGDAVVVAVFVQVDLIGGASQGALNAQPPHDAAASPALYWTNESKRTARPGPLAGVVT
jgi:hypothetical protein